MKRLVITVSFFLFTSSAFSQSGWIQQQSGITESLHNLYFININTGWAVGDSGIILHTTNGGTNWIMQNSNTRKPLSKIIFMNANTGIVEGDYPVTGIPFCYTGVVSLATTNAGANWIVKRETISITYFTDLNKIGNHYYSSLAGIEIQNCMSSTGEILMTSNNGTSWTNLTPASNLSHQFNTINFINDQEGWAVGEFYNDVPTMWKQKIIRTSNSGINWTIIYNDSIDFNSFKNLRFLDSNTGYLLQGTIWSNTGDLLKSTNGGSNWFQPDSLIATSLNSIYFRNRDTGWCVGWGGKIIRTNNGGTDWTYQNSTVTNYLSSVQFVTPYIGYIVGRGGLLLKTGNGGLTSAGELTSSVPSSYILKQNFPNPFNPVTVISYELPQSNFVTLKIYDALGKEVMTLVNENQSAGNYEIKFNAEKLHSGVYFYKIEAGEFSDVKRMLLLK